MESLLKIGEWAASKSSACVGGIAALDTPAEVGKNTTLHLSYKGSDKLQL